MPRPSNALPAAAPVTNCLRERPNGAICRPRLLSSRFIIFSIPQFLKNFPYSRIRARGARLTISPAPGASQPAALEVNPEFNTIFSRFTKYCQPILRARGTRRILAFGLVCREVLVGLPCFLHTGNDPQVCKIVGKRAEVCAQPLTVNTAGPHAFRPTRLFARDQEREIGGLNRGWGVGLS